MFDKTTITNSLYEKHELFAEDGKCVNIIITPTKNYYEVELWNKDAEFMEDDDKYSHVVESYQEALDLEYAA